MLTGSPAVTLDYELRFGPHTYPYLARSGPQAWAELGSLLAGLDADAFILVADAGLPAAAITPVRDTLRDLADVIELTLTPEEPRKTWHAPGALNDQAIGRDATRRSVIVALGGGLAGNVAGLMAHNLFRGVELVHLPTTLLAVSDSTISRKQAVNSAHGKNHLGGFLTPALVFSHLDLLRTLPPDEIRAAWCEAAKNAVGILPGRLGEFADRIRPDAVYSPDELAWFIEFCLDAKQKVVAGDPDEKGPALVLEWGHTIGHVLELLTHGGLGHGQAIGVGGLIAARAATILGVGNPAVEQVHEDLLRRIGAPTQISDGLTADGIVSAARKDNKAGYRRRLPAHIDMILLEDLGTVHRTEPEPPPPGRGGPTLTRRDASAATYITQVPEAVLREAVSSRLGAGVLEGAST